MSAALQAMTGRMPDDARRAMLLDVPNVGRVRQRPDGRIYLDFSPELRDGNRYLWTFFGKAFESREAAELVRRRICQDAVNLPLVDAVARYRGRRSKAHKALDVIDRYLEAAPGLISERTDRRLAPRTIDAYARVLKRARPFFADMTILEATQADTLRRFKAWFQLPPPAGRGVSEQEARNAFAAFRAVVAWYRTTRTDFPEPDWPSMPTAITAKRRNRSRREVEHHLTLPQVVRAIDHLPPDRQPIFWVMFYTGARITEARGVLGLDWQRPRLRVCRSAENRKGGCAVQDTAKTLETGTYELPEWICNLIDQHRKSIDPQAPLFQSPDPRAPGGTISDDALRDAWMSACDAAGVPRVSVYRAMKHTQVGALRAAGISIDDTINHYRLTEVTTLDHYDEQKDSRRDAVVTRLDELVGRARILPNSAADDG